MNINPQRSIQPTTRRGSTLIIVIALLGLLAFTGMVFFTFAAQERAAAEYFSESAKSSSEEVEDPFPWAMQQIVVGTTNLPEQKGSILWSPTQRHSIVRNMVGNDIAPHTGTGLHVVLDSTTGFPVIDNDYSGTQDFLGTNPATTALANKLNFVDAQAGWGRSLGRNVEGLLAQFRPIQEFDVNGNGQLDAGEDVNRNGALDPGEDTNLNSILDRGEDLNSNGVLDADEDTNRNGILDGAEDRNNNGFLDVVGVPAPDVDYTYPDINHLFFGYKGWSIRDNGTEEDLNLNGILDPGEDVNTNGRLDRRYEQVRTFIPSFFRPQYLKSALNQGKVGLDVPTDPNWFDETGSPTHQQYAVRSFRPHAFHITGFDSSGNPVLRFLDKNNPAHVGAIAALPGTSGHFPLRRNEGNAATQFNGPNFGKLGVWTGDGAATSTTFELDSDNDGDGIKEGIWLDLRYPLQETADGRKYTVMHSFTIYDLDGLIDLNTHGNLAGLPRNAVINGALAGPGGLLESTFLSQSNSGVGPHEINPTYALAPIGFVPDSDAAVNPKFVDWYASVPSNRLEQANMELAWLLTGRIEGAVPTGAEVFDGRWGDASALWFHRFTGGGRRVNSLPRPGRAGNLSQTSTDVVNNFGGAAGFDDNQDAFEGLASAVTGRKRGIVHPVDYAGRGRRTDSANPLSPILVQPVNTLPEQWTGYLDYPLVGNATGIADNASYIGGKDGDATTGVDNLVAYSNATSPSNFNQNFEDPYETIVDIDRAVRPDDQIFTPLDMISAHLTKTDEDNATGLSDRLENLAPFTFADNSSRAEFFTTLSNSFRHFSFGQDLASRPWEWTANSDNDAFLEFPPMFGYGEAPANAVLPYSTFDPFRPQTRRLLLTEAMEGRGVPGQLPLSLNQVLDVVRTAQTPREGTPEFQRFMQRSGLRFRPLTEHPISTEVDGAGDTARDTVTTIPTVPSNLTTPLPTFPPQTFEDREFWARRDRQQMARDLFVLLYTIGGAEFDNTVTPNRVRDYTGDNAGRLVYSEDRVRLMAQFAVNVVDAMDSDNVITKFEYDKNLHDGWGLDDDAYTFSTTSDPSSSATTTAIDFIKSGMYPDDTADRGIVYGVEAQQLAFSEVLGIRSANTGNNDGTPYDDSRGGTANPTYFLFTELQNMLPSKAVLGSGLTSGETAATSVWRLVRKDRATKADPSQLTKEAAPAVPPAYLAFATNVRNEIDGGGRFTISATTATGGTIPSSDFFVDVGAYDTMTTAYTGMFDNTYELIAPNTSTGTLPTTTTPATDPAWAPRCDLDLIVHTTAYYQSAVAGELLLPDVTTFTYNGHDGILEGDANRDGDGIPATSVSGNPEPVFLEPGFGGTSEGFDLVLERRLNPDLPSVSEIQNPWIEVDRVRVPFKNFDINAMDTAVDLRNNGTRLQAVVSTERTEPLQNALSSHAPVTTGVNSFRSNSLKGDVNTTTDDTFGGNSSSSSFKVWQPHFDREFVSTGELLNVPVYPPNMLTQRLASARRPPLQQLARNSLPIAPEILNAAGAAALFLLPDWTPDGPGPATANDNRWYRLLQFVEVPSRVNRTLGNYVNLKRLPGKLNPNTIRDREIYAGLLDDPQFMDTNPLSDLNGNLDLDGPFTLGNGSAFDGRDGLDAFPLDADSVGKRDRWLELINERDGNVQSIKDPTPDSPGPNLPNDEVQATYWIPGAPNSRPFRSFNSLTTKQNDDSAFEQTILRRLGLDKPAVIGNSRANVAGDGNTNYVSNVTLDPDSNRHWLEAGDQDYHKTNQGIAPAPAATTVEHHQLLSKIMNNTTTVSNTFIMYGTAAYFEVYEDPVTGLVQVGGRMGLDLDADSDPRNDAGWEQRAVFILDRTELFNAYDPGSGSVDWKRLVKHRVNLTSDGK